MDNKEQIPKLTIYKASAGSGKTFQLTQEYLKLIFNSKQSFRSILAVTFTNKATAEMRERILKELHTLSIGEKSEHKKELLKEFRFTDKELQKRAQFLLKQILHNYSRFNISTIDSFFQKILKAFTRETGLVSGFNVELNTKTILEHSIEQFFDNVNSNKDIKEWLSNYAIQKIENGKSWDIEKDIYKFSSEAFNEVFLSFSEEQLADFSKIENFKTYKKQLSEITTKFIKTLHEYGRDSVLQIEKHNLNISDFSNGKSGIAGFLSKLETIKSSTIKELGARVLKANNSTDGIDGWSTKTSKKQIEIQNCVNTGLGEILQKTVSLFNSDYEQYNTAQAILKGIDVFAVVVEVFNQLNQYCREKNIFLLPMASPLLAKMIGEDDAPFIYEKTGEYIKHFMIDEFQDTSKIQWNNFSPLFLNGISQGDNSLVVGDVKQSIYRWRNGDWTLLNNKLANDFSLFGVKNINLEYNWRSTPEIINFNNWIFKEIAEQAIDYLIEKKAPEQITDEYFNTIRNIYSSAAQQIPEKNRNLQGKTCISFCNEGKDKDENNKWYLDKMVDSLLEILDSGIQPKDIAILVRRWKEGALIAKHLMEYIQEHPDKKDLLSFVSNDSVLLGASSSILLIIALLEFLVNDKNKESKAAAVYFYLLQTNSASTAAKKLIDIDFSSNEQFLSHLPAEFKTVLGELRKLPFPTIINKLLAIFIYSNNPEKVTNQLPFIHTFQDIVLNYSQNNGNEISDFLNWWKEYGIITPINLSEEQNAIRIITIHKSKGLEYKAVIVPFANWGLDQLPKYIWCKTPEAYNKFSIVPVRYSSALTKTKFAGEYWTERIMALVDNINLLYVAFTRAIDALYIFAPKPAKEGVSSKISDLIFNMCEISENMPGAWDKQNLEYINGNLSQQKQSIKTTLETKTHIPPILNKKRNLKIRLTDSEFFKNDDGQIIRKINKGSIYHKIMERIFTYKDIEPSVNYAVTEGLLPKDEMESLIKKLKNILLSTEVKSWFNGSYRILNESSIIINTNSTKRPDRVMFGDNEIIVVDYKFTATHSPNHIKQVKEYMKNIELIENRKTTGYVWYVLENSVVQVNLQ